MDNRSFERMEEFKYLGTTLTNQNYIQEEIKSRLKSGNVCYHLVQNLLSSSLLSRNIKIKGKRESGEDYIMRSLMICTPHQVLFG